MFYCRRLLVQSHATRFISPHTSTSRIYPNAIWRVPITLAFRHFNGEAPDRPGSSVSTHTSPEQVLQSKLTPPFEAKSPHTGENETTSDMKLSDYMALRERDRTLVAALPIPTYAHVLNQATKPHSSPLVQQIINDAVQMHINPREVLHSIVESCRIQLLPPAGILSILQRLHELDGSLNTIKPEVFERLFVLLVQETKIRSLDRSLLPLLYPIILARLPGYKVPYGALALTYHPPTLVRMAFYAIHRLLAQSRFNLALDLFRALVDLGHIPPEAIHEGDGSLSDFDIIIYATLVRASLHWDWRQLAAQLLEFLLSTPRAQTSTIHTLAVDAIYSLLENPTSADMRACGQIIKLAHGTSPLPDGLVRQFYVAAAQLNQGVCAEELYAFSRSSAVLEQHSYPPPQGLALPWVFRHLAYKSEHIHLVRQLATEVVDNNIPIPLQFRAQFIATTASKGFGVLSRILWERYATGKDKDAVVGNSALLVRMVSLFYRISQGKETALDFIEKSGQVEEGNKMAERLTNLTDFLALIISEYRKQHEPLVEASHRALTSLARASFILGRFADGFDAFRVLLDRREVPDLYDVNVALSAMAEQDPRAAAKMIERMIEHGLEPDAVTFGTVMHFAKLHGDRVLVDDMIRRTRGRKDTMLSLKSVAMLVRVGLTPVGVDSKELQQQKLEEAWRLLHNLDATDFVSSPQTGKFLVFRSLKAESPVLAFKFWKLLLKGTDWNDQEQVFQRALIARMIYKQQTHGILDEKARNMIIELHGSNRELGY